jgi:hypothetical protein
MIDVGAEVRDNKKKKKKKKKKKNIVLWGFD